MPETTIIVRMSHAGRLHLARRVAGQTASRMLCGVWGGGAKDCRAEMWESEQTQFKCQRCMKFEPTVARPS